MPYASAITFFTAPPSSQPITSSLVYGRKYGVVMACCTWLRPVHVGARHHGRGRLLGGDLAGQVGPGDHDDPVRVDPGGLDDHLAHPLGGAQLDALHQARPAWRPARTRRPSRPGCRAASATAPRARPGRRRRSPRRRPRWRVTRSGSFTAGSVAGVAPGTRGWRRRPTARRAQTVTSAPASASILANAVPQEPAPSTAARLDPAILPAGSVRLAGGSSERRRGRRRGSRRAGRGCRA